MAASKQHKTLLSMDEAERIITKYDQTTLQISEAYLDGGIDPLWRRFERAVMNQCESGEATLSRYAIWANTVRDNIIQAMCELENGNGDEGNRLLIRAANSLSAFSEIQACFDPLGIGEKLNKRLGPEEDAMIEPQLLSVLRRTGWSGVPSAPGIYWWYFPQNALENLCISKLSDVTKLRLRSAPDGKVCLYHGMANNLAERIKWHAAQKLTLQSLQSGFLSTFRFTLLALNDFDYLQGAEEIDSFFDSLSIRWRVSTTRGEAEEMEQAELQGEYQYPLNIQGNQWPELVDFVRYLKSRRSAYKRRFVQTTT